MVIAALAVAEGMMKLMRAWMPYIADSEATGELPSKPSCIPWRMLSTTLPSCRMTMIPEANPTTRAADRMSRAPAMSSSAIRLAENPAMIPHRMPIPRNRPVISGMYQSQQVTPTMRAMTVRRRTTRTQDWRFARCMTDFSTPPAASLEMTEGAPVAILSLRPSPEGASGEVSFFVLRA